MASPGGSPGRDASSRSGLVLPLASQSPLAPSPGGLGAPGAAETTALARRAQEAFSALQQPANPGSSLYDVYEPSGDEARGIVAQVEELGARAAPLVENMFSG